MQHTDVMKELLVLRHRHLFLLPPFPFHEDKLSFYHAVYVNQNQFFLFYCVLEFKQNKIIETCSLWPKTGYCWATMTYQL
jgi:hypothetical protein